MVVGFALQSIQVSGGQEHNMRLGQSAFLLVLCSCRNKRRIYWSIKWRIVLILESNITSSWSFYIHGGRICLTKHSSIRWPRTQYEIGSICIFSGVMFLQKHRWIYWSIKWRIVLILESNITLSWNFYIHGGRICPTKHSSIRWSVIELHITSHFRTQNTVFFITSSLIILSSLIFKPRKERENMEGNRQTSKSRNLSSLSTMIHQGLLRRALSQVS